MGKYKSIVGERYGRVVVVSEGKEKRPNGTYKYIATYKCDCGNIRTATKHNLTRTYKDGRPHTQSCGCLQKEKASDFGKKNHLPFGEGAFNSIYRSYLDSAKKRGYEFSLSKEQFKEIIVKPCLYCGETASQKQTYETRNGDFLYTGIDRYDNTKGYTVENSVPCCKVCNRIKTNMRADYLAHHLELMLKNKNHWLKNPLP